MTYAAQLIDAAITATGATSQTAFARQLGIAQPTISQWRNGHGSPMPQDRVVQLCEMAGIAPEDHGYWINGVMRDAVTSTGVRRALDGVLDRLRPTLARVGILGVVMLAGYALPPSAQATTMQAEQPSACTLCAI